MHPTMCASTIGTIVICTILLGLALRTFIRCMVNPLKYSGVVPIGLLASTIIVGLGLPHVAGWLATDRAGHETVASTIHITALNTDKDTSGTVTNSLFVSRTTIGQKPVLNYLQRLDGGGYRIGSVDGGSEIVQDATPTTAHIDTVRCRYASVWTRFLIGGSCGDRVVVHVPPNSIVTGFQVKLPGQ